MGFITLINPDTLNKLYIIVSQPDSSQVIMMNRQAAATYMKKQQCNNAGIPGFRLQVSGFRLQVSGFRVQVTGFRLQVADQRNRRMIPIITVIITLNSIMVVMGK